jgi:DnaJ-class molecular chaperone
MQDDKQDRIRERAHAIWEQEGHPEGRDADHWARAEQEAGSAGQQPPVAEQSTAPMSAGSPGDDAAPGTAGTGEDVCPKCQGSGRLENAVCENCGGTGIVIKGVAGG